MRYIIIVILRAFVVFGVFGSRHLMRIIFGAIAQLRKNKRFPLLCCRRVVYKEVQTVGFCLMCLVRQHARIVYTVYIHKVCTLILWLSTHQRSERLWLWVVGFNNIGHRGASKYYSVFFFFSYMSGAKHYLCENLSVIKARR